MIVTEEAMAERPDRNHIRKLSSWTHQQHIIDPELGSDIIFIRALVLGSGS